jgi:DNA-binding transcriptional LysR family regulator
MDFNLDRLRTFIVVARTGNLSATARELRASQPNVGRQMAALEKEVGLILFARHSRGLDLTKQGKEFLDLCNDIVGRLAQGIDVIREKDSAPSGCLKVISESGMQKGILEKLSSFSHKFPDINISFSSVRDPYQLQIGGADVAIMLELVNDPDFIQLPLYEMILRVYASPAYLKSYGKPQSIGDLQSHKIIIYEGDENAGLFNSLFPDDIIKSSKRFITVTNASDMNDALINGLGIGCTGYNKNNIERSLLIDLFPDMPDKIIPYYFTYHRHLEGTPKVKAFYDFLKEDVANIWQRSDKQQKYGCPPPNTVAINPTSIKNGVGDDKYLYFSVG